MDQVVLTEVDLTIQDGIDNSGLMSGQKCYISTFLN